VASELEARFRKQQAWLRWVFFLAVAVIALAGTFARIG
jgi:hypothetical protein